MSDVMTKAKPEKTVKVVCGQHHRFMLLPIMEHEAEFFPMGPITFGVEGRVLGSAAGVVGERGASIHVFNADRTEEWLRFDCFDGVPHYHYILHDQGHNVVWGYDPEANGPMLPWALNALRTRLPQMLRKAGADALADAVEDAGVDEAVLAQVETAMLSADERIRPGLHMIEPGRAWYARWKELHPEFNTVDE